MFGKAAETFCRYLDLGDQRLARRFPGRGTPVEHRHVLVTQILQAFGGALGIPYPAVG